MFVVITATALIAGACTSSPETADQLTPETSAQPPATTEQSDEASDIQERTGPVTADTPIDSWANDERGNPAFDKCPANQGNPRATYGDLDRLVPCYNTFWLVRVTDGVPGNAAGNIDDGTVDIKQRKGFNQPPRSNWRLTVLSEGNTYYVNYNWATRFTTVEIYYKSGNGPWQLGGNVNDYDFPTNLVTDFLFVAHDPKKPVTDSVKLNDNAFSWETVQKAWGNPHFA
jgi:hypothetical protein